MTDLPRVLALVGDEAGPIMWRIWAPFAELQRRGVLAHWKHRSDPELNDDQFLINLSTKFHAVILPRLSWKEHEAARFFLSRLRLAGLAVILEIDDDIYSPSIVEHQSAVFERERIKGAAVLEQNRLDRIWLLSQCDGITVSSRRLQTIVQAYTSTPVEVVPNAIDVAWFKSRLRVARAIPPLTIGWAGGARYDQDLAPLAAAWHAIAARYPHVRFVLQGHIAQMLADAVPSDRIHYLAWRPLADYPSGLLNIDIACCSVAPTLFNTAKTPIKVWEYTLAGAACVVSPTLYGPVVTDGEDALVAQTADEWSAALARLVEDADLRRQLQHAQRRRVMREHSLATNWWRWPAAWQTILEQTDRRRSILDRLVATA